jgi:hypothetical protein
MTTEHSTQSIRDALEQTYQDNRALLAQLTDADLDRPTANPKWQVRQLAGHIAEDAAGTVYVGKLLARGKNAKAPDFVVNLANWWGLRKYKRVRAAGLLPIIDARQRELMAWVGELTPDALANGGEISGMGRMTLAEFLIANCAHGRDHGADLQAALHR